MSGHSGRGRLRLPVISVGLAACLVLAIGCGGKPDANSPSGNGTGAADAGAKPPLIALIRAADWMGTEWGEDAIKVGLRESGLEPGRDFELKISSAQGDLATLPSLIDAALDAKAKVIVTLQDATLQAAVQRTKSVPIIIFNLLSDPFAAGAGTSDSSHLPNITGVYSPGFGDPEQTRRVELIRRVAPKARRIGILFSPEEQLSVIFKDRMTKAAQQAGLQVTAAPVSSVAEVGNATRSLCGKADAIELYGNVAHAGFASLIKVANECKVPVFSPSPFEVLQGAVASFFPDFQEGGVEAGKMVARVLKGENPAAIPFYRLETTKLIVNPGGAGKAGITLPEDVVKKADTVVGESAKKE